MMKMAYFRPSALRARARPGGWVVSPGAHCRSLRSSPPRR